MLDEEEYIVIHKIYSQCFHDGHSPDLPEKWKPVSEAYSKMTGAPEMFHNAIMHHRIALYGPPCRRCNKPLRTPSQVLRRLRQRLIPITEQDSPPG